MQFENAKAILVKRRRNSSGHREFLKMKVQELESLILIFINTERYWAFEPLIVQEKDPERRRFKTDLRPVKKETLPMAWPMPYLKTVT